MDIRGFYSALFAPLERMIGHIDQATLVPIVGFDAGGPLMLCTIHDEKDSTTTYVSCELAWRCEQLPNSHGRYELLMSCDDENWCRSILTDVARMTFDEAFDHQHTLDIGPWVHADCPVQGLWFERLYAVNIDLESFNVLRVVGMSRLQVEQAAGAHRDRVIESLRSSTNYPRVMRHAGNRPR